MSTKHTPGPWTVSARANNMIDVYHHNKQPGSITMALCRVQARQSWVAEAEANARLISAAPDLLAALRFYASSCDATETTPCGYEGNLCCKTARAAIAKATGEEA